MTRDEDIRERPTTSVTLPSRAPCSPDSQDVCPVKFSLEEGHCPQLYQGNQMLYLWSVTPTSLLPQVY